MDILNDYNNDETEPAIIHCSECRYFRPYNDAKGYGRCMSNHTFDGAFRDIDYCSYAKKKEG